MATMRLTIAACAAAAVPALAGCGSSDSRKVDTHAVEVVARAQAEWIRNLRASARDGDRAARFPSPPRAVLLRRLHRAARLYGFRVVSVRMLHLFQSAPLIVIRSGDGRALARATPHILALADPHRPTTANPAGFAYEGYFLLAETEHGNPYFATFNFQRAPHVGGGEWAASEDLYPFPHG